MIGALSRRDGVVGASAALDGRISMHRAVVQLPGRSLQCPVQQLKELLDGDKVARAKINAHEAVLFSQTQQSAACNVTHNVENRLARWLLRARDLIGGDELNLTQEYVAEMLGVGRTTCRSLHTRFKRQASSATGEATSSSPTSMVSTRWLANATRRSR